jgi:hypothetical protein
MKRLLILLLLLPCLSFGQSLGIGAYLGHTQTASTVTPVTPFDPDFDGKVYQNIDFTDPLNITTDGTDSVISVLDQSVNNRNLSNDGDNSGTMPIYTTGVVKFTGNLQLLTNDDFFTTSMTTYLLIRQDSWSNFKAILQNCSIGFDILITTPITPKVALCDESNLGGITATRNDGLIVGEWHIVTIILDRGAGTCSLQIDNNAPTTGAYGDNYDFSLTLGNSLSAARFSIKAWIVRENVDDAATQTSIINLLNTTYP